MNKEPNASVRSLIYWLIQDKKIDSNCLFYFIDFFWPKFIKVGPYIFLQDEYVEKEYEYLLAHGENLEYWINLFTIDEYFTELTDQDEKSIELVKYLSKIWKLKLMDEFPELDFVVECLYSTEYGDCGLTFYQKSSDAKAPSDQMFYEISTPNIKENRLEHSANGTRRRISKIRRPRMDEIPD